MKAAGWMTTLIQRARTSGLDDADIAAALERSIVFRPVRLDRNDRARLVGTMTDGDMTLTELLESTRRTR
jgi:hypothetical protein